MQLGAVQIPEELSAFVDFLKMRSFTNVMEIGSEAGGTFWLWCQLAEAKGVKISLDWPDGDSGSGRFRDPRALAARSQRFQGFALGVHVITGDSHSTRIREDVVRALGDEKLDLLFIDGDHSYEGVKADYRDYRALVRRGGLIAFHDINDSDYHRRRGCFVGQLWREFYDLPGLVVKREFTEGHEWGGIGVLEV